MVIPDFMQLPVQWKKQTLNKSASILEHVEPNHTNFPQIPSQNTPRVGMKDVRKWEDKAEKGRGVWRGGGRGGQEEGRRIREKGRSY